MIQISGVMVRSALGRQESRGDHNREDYPDKDNSNWLKHTVVTQVAGEDELNYTEVVSTRWNEKEMGNGSHS
jgi:succinate dehydrogenase / fumarate reductase flavoprotein subunit